MGSTTTQSCTADIDVLIAGQGLAGSLLAWHLIRLGQRVLVVDEHHRGSSSMAAAGLLNPVTGMRLVKSHQVEDCLPAALGCYRSLAQHFHRPFFHPRPMLRLFGKPGEIKQWEKRRADSDYRPWIGDCFSPLSRPELIAPLGGFRQFHTGFLDIPALLSQLAQWLTMRQALRLERLETRHCRLTEQGVHWQGLNARRLILCTGHRASHCPWFGGLPFQPVKGEILTLQGPETGRRHILNRGHWLLPTRNGQVRLGASYERQQLDAQITAKARTDLLRALESLLTRPDDYHLVNQLTGIRPATLDTRPFLGLHPRHPQLGIFNGFGSKGSLLIPWHAQRFARYLTGHGELPATADIDRYASHLKS